MEDLTLMLTDVNAKIHSSTILCYLLSRNAASQWVQELHFERPKPRWFIRVTRGPLSWECLLSSVHHVDLCLLGTTDQRKSQGSFLYRWLIDSSYLPSCQKFVQLSLVHLRDWWFILGDGLYFMKPIYFVLILRENILYCDFCYS